MKRIVDELWFDSSYALRQLGASKTFALVAVIVLAVGVGVNAALFSFVDAALLQPRPGVSDDRGLVLLLPKSRENSQRSFRYEEYVDIRERQTVFEELAAKATSEVVVDLDGASVPARANFVGGGFFATLRLRMAAGTGFPRGPDRGAPPNPVVVVSHEFWQTRLGGLPDAIGRTLRVNRMPLTIVGVMPERYLDDGVLWLPMAAHRLLAPRQTGTNQAPDLRSAAVSLVARLRAGVTLDQAQAQINGIAQSIGATYSRSALSAVTIIPWRMATPGEILGATAVFGNVTLLILLIACANVGVLLLGRAVARRREIAVRLALGASRARVIRQLTTEGVLLAVAAGAVGLLVLHWLGDVIRTQFGDTLPLDFSPNWRTISATIAFAAGTGILFALVPALHATRVSVSETLKDVAAGLDRRGLRLQRAFVIAEVALSMALVCMTGIFVQAARRASAPELGYDTTDQVLIAELDLPLARYSGARADALLHAARERLAAMPGVGTVSFANSFPHWYGWSYGVLQTDVPDSIGPRDARYRPLLNRVDADFFGAAGIPILQGRGITALDLERSQPVAVIDEVLARILWPDQNPVGRRLSFERFVSSTEAPSPPVRHDVAVVGVAGAVQERSSMNEGRPVVYLPRTQVRDSGRITLILRSEARSARPLVTIVREELRRLDPELPVRSVQTMDQYEASRHGELRDVGVIAALAGLLALALACVGVYAVIAFGLAQRMREVGIRLALGARPAQLVALFFRDGMRLTMVGFAIGVPLGLAVMKIAMSREFGVQTLTIASISSILVVLLGVAVFASWLPARRAAAVDPAVTLRHE